MDTEKLAISETTDGKPPRAGWESASAPAPIGSSGQHEAYWVLSAEERSKGFVRPVRRSYLHVGIEGPKYPLRDLDDNEIEWYSKFGYVKYEEYPKGESCCGRYWTQPQLDKIGNGCGSKTMMGQALAETYARDPRYYGATFCCHCGTHLPVGESGEFIWDDGSKERVGT